MSQHPPVPAVYNGVCAVLCGMATIVFLVGGQSPWLAALNAFASGVNLSVVMLTVPTRGWRG